MEPQASVGAGTGETPVPPSLTSLQAAWFKACTGPVGRGVPARAEVALMLRLTHPAKSFSGK